MKYLFLFLLIVVGYTFYGQNAESGNPPKLQVNLNPEGTGNIRFITLMQAWYRVAELNPGSVYKGKERNDLSDISVRRLVLTTVAQLSPEVLILVNVSATANSGDTSFQQGLNTALLDAYGEYKVNKYLYIGAGLHQWTGLSRLNVDGVGSIINLDHPLFQQVTWNRLDRLGRMMGIYGKGEIYNLNYRLSVNEAFTVNVSPFAADTGRGSPNGGFINEEAKNAQEGVAYFNPVATSKLIQGYFEYNFWEKENHTTPYETNTYHGEKKLLNVGTGFIFRRNGIFTPTQIGLRNNSVPESSTNPTIIKDGKESDLFAFAADATVMYPFSTRLDGLAAYFAYYNVDLGPNYYTVSPVVPVTTAAAGVSSINGSGTGFPSTGTGETFYSKLGYIAPRDWFGTSRVGVFATYQNSRFEALRGRLEVYEAGMNWFIRTNKVKMSVLYRSRPVYKGNAAYDNVPSTAVTESRKGEIITQLQFNF